MWVAMLVIGCLVLAIGAVSWRWAKPIADLQHRLHGWGDHRVNRGVGAFNMALGAFMIVLGIFDIRSL